MTERLASLFSPITINTMTLSNRAVMAPMGTNLGNPDSTVSEASIAYLKRHAQGRPGLIITEVIGVHQNGLAIDTQLGLFDDRFIPGLRKLTEQAHEEGCRIAAQLHHAGRESFFSLAAGTAIGPSAVPSLIYRTPPREMTADDIGEIIAAFGDAAGRAREAGFDAVEVHGAHGYLLTQFLSPLANQRTDAYGGPMENRSRFIVEILEAVRKRVGPDFPLSLRLSLDESIKGGYSVDDIQPVLPSFVKAGADIIHASFGTHGSPAGITSAPAEYEPGFNARLARKAKDVVAVPVIAVGRFTDPALADEVIGRGDADLVAFGRQFLADPDFLIKSRENRTGDICTCIACNQGCIERLMLGEGSVRCALNPETGQELSYPSHPAREKRTLWVIGAGPGGLTAAHEAARLGHHVTLFEKEPFPGGLVRTGSRAPFKELHGRWIEWLVEQAKGKGVEIRTATSVTGDMLREHRPGMVILACGGEPIIPVIPGIDREHVCTALQVLEGETAPGKNVLIIGGGQTGMETADYCIERGARVIIVEVLKRSPVLKFTSHGYMLHKRLRDAGCTMLFGTSVADIGNDSVTVVSDGAESVLSPVDQVIVATGLRPREYLKKALVDAGIPHVVIGDARKIGRIIEATGDGARAAWEL
ncbi:MAG: FAD-dependent oxidoreductase [Deltaproteobacteria bacterium]|nr:FAD-dependent oxidoreductase [Deltaproteobacteria bacterium]